MLLFRPIGAVHSPLNQLKDCPLQEDENAPEATIEIFDEFRSAARHIKAGEMITLLTWLDKADRSIMTTKPRNDPNAPQVGVFSTHSPDRPNPIGIHYTMVKTILSENKFLVTHLEVLDNTPLLDIKTGKM